MSSMSEKTLNLGNALEVIHSGEVFSIEFITCDRNRKKGGDWVKVEEAMKVFKNRMEDPKVNKLATVKPNRLELNKQFDRYQKATIFIEILKCDSNRMPPGMRIDIHVDLIMKLNGRKILLAPKAAA